MTVGVAYMAINIPAPGFKERTFELWVLNRWVFNFYVCSTPLRGKGVGERQTQRDKQGEREN